MTQGIWFFYFKMHRGFRKESVESSKVAPRSNRKILKKCNFFFLTKNCLCVYLLRENGIISVNWQSLVDRIRIQTKECEFPMNINSGEGKNLKVLK